MASSAESNRWVIVSLTSVGEKEASVKSLTKAIRSILRSDLEVFVPAATQNARQESHTFFYMDGYVFIEFRDKVEYLKLQDTTYFRSVLCEPKVVNGKSTYVFSLLNDSDLDVMRNGVKSLGKKKCTLGDRVKVSKGEHRNLCGEVVLVYDDEKTIQVSVNLRSKKLLIDFPATYLMVINE